MKKLGVELLAFSVLVVGCLDGIGNGTVEDPSTNQNNMSLTLPIKGAVALPPSVNLTLPFPTGARIKIDSGYSGHGGSKGHVNTENWMYSNDYYALDFLVEGAINNGKGLPVIASLEGTVVVAGWAPGAFDNYGLHVVIAHDLGDGNVYTTHYAHLNVIDPKITEGAWVHRGQYLGELGQTCELKQRCLAFHYPHLHYAIYQHSRMYRKTYGPYGGHAVVPEPLENQGNLKQEDILTSTTEPYCESDECLLPTPCLGRDDGLSCDVDEIISCENEQVTSWGPVCLNGCSEGACQCRHYLRKGIPIDSGDCIQLPRSSGCQYRMCDNGGFVTSKEVDCLHEIFPNPDCPPSEPPCQPKTCAELSKECESWDDGCGKMLNCGGCKDPSHSCCDGTCKSLDNDPKNCGACGIGCGADQECAHGSCQDWCIKDFYECDSAVDSCCSGTCCHCQCGDFCRYSEQASCFWTCKNMCM